MTKTASLLILTFLTLTAVGRATEHCETEIHGFITQGYLKSDRHDFIAETSDGTFQFNEMGLHFNKKLMPGLDASIQFFAYDFGPMGNDQITINQASVTAYYNNFLTLKAGKTKVCYGFYGDGRDMDMLRAFVFLPQGVYPEIYRETIQSAKGIEFYGSGYPEIIEALPPIGEFYYHFQYGAMDIPKDTGISKVISMTMHTKANESSSKPAGNIVVGWEAPFPGFRLQGQCAKFNYHISGTTFDDSFWEAKKQEAIGSILAGIDEAYRDELAHQITIANMPIFFSGELFLFIYGAEFTWSDLTLAAEGTLVKVEIDADVNYMAAGAQNTYPYLFKNDTLGYYAMGSYRFSDLIKMGIYYSVYYPNKDDRSMSTGITIGAPDYFAWQKDSCMALQFDLNDNAIFKIEGHYMDGCAQLAYMKPLKDYSETRRYWYLFAAKLSFSF